MKRVKEPSTWAGIGALLQAAKVFLPPHYAVIADGVTALAGSLAVYLKEQPKEQPKV